MSHDAIRKKFDSMLRTYGVANNIPVATQNSPFRPTVGKLYIKTTLMPASTRTLTLAGSDHTKYTGLYQVSLYIPNDVGLGDIDGIRDDLSSMFPVYKYVQFNTAKEDKVMVMSPIERGDPSNGDTHCFVALWFEYRCDK